jgi:hypothetical protein
MSQRKRVLAEVRKNPGASSDTIAATVGGTATSVSTTLLRLMQLKLVRRERASYYRASDARRVSRFIYFCEDRAVPKETPAAPVPAVVADTDIVPATTGQAPAPDPVPTTLDILRLPLGEARALYRQLRAFFED